MDEIILHVLIGGASLAAGILSGLLMFPPPIRKRPPLGQRIATVRDWLEEYDNKLKARIAARIEEIKAGRYDPETETPLPLREGMTEAEILFEQLEAMRIDRDKWEAYAVELEWLVTLKLQPDVRDSWPKTGDYTAAMKTIFDCATRGLRSATFMFHESRLPRLTDGMEKLGIKIKQVGATGKDGMGLYTATWGGER